MTMSAPRQIATLAVLALVALRPTAAAGDTLLRSSAAPTFTAERGFVRDWLVCGPLPNPLAPGAKQRDHTASCLGYHTDYLVALGGESAAWPREGDAVAHGDQVWHWRLYQSPSDLIDFDAMFVPNDDVVAYAFCVIQSDQARDAILAVGSDDGIKIWLNGKCVHDHHVGRGAAVDNDLANVRLRRGRNTCLVKVDEGHGGWGFFFRLTNAVEELKALGDDFGKSVSLAVDKRIVKPGDTLKFTLQADRRVTLHGPTRAFLHVTTADGRPIAVLRSAINSTVTWKSPGRDCGLCVVRATVRTSDGKEGVREQRFFCGDVKARAEAAQALAAAYQPPPDGDPRLPLLARVLGCLAERVAKKPDDTGDLALRLLHELELAMEGLRSDTYPFQHLPGTFTRYYPSEVDGSLQGYGLYVPRQYDPRMPTPLVLALHGHAGGNPGFEGHSENWVGSFAGRGDHFGYLIAVPFGRGNTGFEGVGHDDVIQVVEDISRDYNVDANRIYVFGASMGGSGGWRLATRAPDRWAAVVPICGGADFRVWHRGYRTLPAIRRFFETAINRVNYTDSMLHVPTYAMHGARDTLVEPDHSRRMVRGLKRIGAEVIYREDPKAGHAGFGEAWDDLFKWLGEHRREPWPRRVLIRSALLQYGKSYWVRIDRLSRILGFGRIDARVVSPTKINVDTDDIGAFTLTVSPNLVDTSRPLTIMVDGAAAYQGDVPASGRLHLRRRRSTWAAATEPPAGLRKTADIEGPIRHVEMVSFVVVYGTQGDPEIARADKEEAEDFAASWKSRYHSPCRVKPDTEVTDDDIARYSLVLFGAPGSNRITAAIANSLPLQFEGDAITLGSQRYQGRNPCAAFVYPNPLNPARYVLVYAGLTADATRQVLRRTADFVDYCIMDDATLGPETCLAAGYFDSDWRFDPFYLWTGDEALRQRATPRHLPHHDAPPQGAQVVYLSDLRPAKVQQYLPNSLQQPTGPIQYDRSFLGRPITLGGQTYRKGLGMHADWEIEYDLDAEFRDFYAVVGVDLEGEPPSEGLRRLSGVNFLVHGDDQLLYDSGEMRWDTPPKQARVCILGVKRLRLTVKGRDWQKWFCGHADWADARVVRSRAAALSSSAAR